MAKINENTLAKNVCNAVKTKGPHGDVNITQVKAVQDELLDQLAAHQPRSEVHALLEAHE